MLFLKPKDKRKIVCEADQKRWSIYHRIISYDSGNAVHHYCIQAFQYQQRSVTNYCLFKYYHFLLSCAWYENRSKCQTFQIKIDCLTQRLDIFKLFCWNFTHRKSVVDSKYAVKETSSRSRTRKGSCSPHFLISWNRYRNIKDRSPLVLRERSDAMIENVF